MYQVILYAAIATIVCVMLYSVLGKSVGKGPESGFNPEDLMESNKSDGPKLVAPVLDEHSATGLDAIIKADPTFSPAQFIDGAKGAYSMILEAFASGDKTLLKDLLTPKVYKIYASAIDARVSENLTQVTDLARLKKATVKEASRKSKVGTISVIYDAELTSALLDAEGKVVQGDPDLLSRVSEVWTFTRNLSEKDPNWRLSDVAPSEGDELQSDPTPDTNS